MQFGPCSVYLLASTDADSSIATAQVDGGPIRLLDANVGSAQVGGRLPLVLYWTSDAPVNSRLHGLHPVAGPAGNLVAQQDNLPVQGLAPTDTWQPGDVIRDPYVLDLGTVSEPGML